MISIKQEEALRNADSRNNLRLRINLDGKSGSKKDAVEELGDRDQKGTAQTNESSSQDTVDTDSEDDVDSMEGLSLVSLEDEEGKPK